MWLLNFNVPKLVTNNLVQDYCTGHNNYPPSIKPPFAMAAAINQGYPGSRCQSATSLVQRLEQVVEIPTVAADVAVLLLVEEQMVVPNMVVLAPTV